MRLLLWLFIFGALVVWKSGVLDWPPYAEQAETLWTEAIFLSENDFNYPLLWSQRQIGEGGVRAYSTSILPAVAGVLIRFFREPDHTFIAYRLLNLAAASAIAVFVLQSTKPYIGWLGSIGVTLCLLTMPLFNVQLEMLGMEIFLAAATAGCVVLLAADRPIAALIGAVAAFLLKQSAVLITLMVAAFAVVAWIAAKPIERPARRRVVAVSLVVALAQLGILRAAASGAQLGLFPGADVVLWLLSCPEYYLLLGIALWVYLRRVWKQWRNTGDRSTPRSERLRAVAEDALGEPALLASIIFISLLTIFMLPISFEARYLASGAPLLFVAISIQFAPREVRQAADESSSAAEPLPQRTEPHQNAPWPNRRVTMLVCCVLAWNAINWEGRLLPPLPRHWGLWERSLEYRRDLQSLREAARVASAVNREAPLVVGKLFTHLLFSPEIGYADEPACGYTLVDLFPLGNFRPLLNVVDDRPSELVVVTVQTGEYQMTPPTGDDLILYADDLDPPLIVYRHRFDSEISNSQRTFYEELVRSNPLPLIPFSVTVGGGGNLLEHKELVQRYREMAASPEALRWLAERFDELGEPEMADAIRESLDESPNHRSPADAPTSIDP